jgi:cellobiose-specific phosphotransferase system component IIA
MYKQQRSAWISSTVSALIVTAIVLLIAATVNAQTNTAEGDTINRVQEVAPLPEVRAQSAADNAGSSTSSAPNLPPQRPDIAPGARPMVRMQTATGTVERQAALANIRAARQAAIQDLQTRLAKKRAALENATTSRKALLRATAQGSVINGMSRVAGVLSGAITKIESATARLRVKAEEIAGRGVDVSSVLSKLDEADEYLRLAEEALEGIDVNARYAATGETPAGDWAEVRQQFAEVRDLIRQAQVSIKEAMQTLRSLLTPNQEETS